MKLKKLTIAVALYLGTSSVFATGDHNPATTPSIGIETNAGANATANPTATGTGTANASANPVNTVNGGNQTLNGGNLTANPTATGTGTASVGNIAPVLTANPTANSGSTSGATALQNLTSSPTATGGNATGGAGGTSNVTANPTATSGSTSGASVGNVAGGNSTLNGAVTGTNTLNSNVQGTVNGTQSTAVKIGDTTVSVNPTINTQGGAGGTSGATSASTSGVKDSGNSSSKSAVVGSGNSTSTSGVKDSGNSTADSKSSATGGTVKDSGNSSSTAGSSSTSAGGTVKDVGNVQGSGNSTVVISNPKPLPPAPGVLNAAAPAPTLFQQRGLPANAQGVDLAIRFMRACPATFIRGADLSEIRQKGNSGMTNLIFTPHANYARLGNGVAVNEAAVVEIPKEAKVGEYRYLCLGLMQSEAISGDAASVPIQTVIGDAVAFTGNELKGFSEILLVYIPKESLSVNIGVNADASGFGISPGGSGMIGQMLATLVGGFSKNSGNTFPVAQLGGTFLVVAKGNYPETAPYIDFAPATPVVSEAERIQKLEAELAAAKAQIPVATAPIPQPVVATPKKAQRRVSNETRQKAMIAVKQCTKTVPCK